MKPFESEFYSLVRWFARRGHSKIGFTGSARGMTPGQFDTLRKILTEMKAGGAMEFHTCDGAGSDFEAHQMAREAGARLIGHPPREETRPNGQPMRAHCKFDMEFPPLPIVAA